MSINQNNKRIAKNTVLLYVRMMFIMGISLYTSRIILNTLGIEDFGIYNVVGGIVIMLGFFNNSMSSATQRFLSFELGKKDFPQLVRVFNMSVNIHIIIGIGILILAETIGLWMVNTQLTIPENRMSAANWVFQFSIFSFMVSVFSVPYNAIIIAHERMSVYAWLSILEVSLKLLIVLMLQWIDFDKLELYAVLIFVVSVIIRLIYIIYANRNFTETKYIFFWDKSLFKILMEYAGWNLWGSAAYVLFGQGINILLNIFFGPILNAASGIANQVKSAVNGFVSNFQMAMNPQIIKSYARNDLKYMHGLIFQGAKFSFFLLFAVTLPILLETETILKLWLKIIPDYTVIFTQLILTNILINSISGPLMTAAQASGKIRLYQGVVGGLLLLNLPISYLFLKLGYSPQITFYIGILISIIALFSRLIIISPLVKLSIVDYLRNVVFRIIPVSLLALILPIMIRWFLPQDIYRLIIICFTSIISIIFAIYSIGLDLKEKIFIQEKIKKILVKK
ncbi:MATE family efflux transporter [Lutibacter citreus]|uniref:lipopolysaccharide biosynthesis protein n=1 Tax=Lutibacter citreus TaxID=2138210 RepID=UPI000DBE7174|nr:lipopolysaccharide biosynthesis protein [Lutibacter citreus]